MSLDPKLSNERKRVTVLFADISGSTRVIERLDPEEAALLLTPPVAVMTEVVQRYEGTVVKVMGDGIMAIFGAPLALEHHAHRACHAALEMGAASRSRRSINTAASSDDRSASSSRSSFSARCVSVSTRCPSRYASKICGWT